MITISEQIECIEREISQRKRVYPRLVTSGKMTQQKADREILTMYEILKTLRAIESKERLI